MSTYHAYCGRHGPWSITSRDFERTLLSCWRKKQGSRRERWKLNESTEFGVKFVTGALLGSSVARVQHSPQEALCSVRLPQVGNGPVWQGPSNWTPSCSSYSCSTCGARYCSLRCLETHEDTRQKLKSFILMITEKYQVSKVDGLNTEALSLLDRFFLAIGALRLYCNLQFSL